MQKAYSRPALVAYIVQELADGADESKLAQRVAAYLINTNKIYELDSVMRDAQELRAQQSGVVELTIRSAHELDAAQRKQIESLAKAQYPATKKVLTHQVHDESVVGGASVQFPHASLDVTVRAKLNQLREAVL